MDEATFSGTLERICIVGIKEIHNDQPGGFSEVATYNVHIVQLNFEESDVYFNITSQVC